MTHARVMGAMDAAIFFLYFLLHILAGSPARSFFLYIYLTTFFKGRFPFFYCACTIQYQYFIIQYSPNVLRIP